MKLRVPSLLLAAASVCAAALASCGDHDVPPGEVACLVKPTVTFNERIAPLLSDTHVSTCNECHLSGVNLSVFARPTPCQTWVCMVDQGLVNVRSPEDSKVLAWIERGTPKSDLITPDVIAAEHDAFRDWIDAHAACPTACDGVTCGPPSAGPTCNLSNDSLPDPDASPAASTGGAGGAGGAEGGAGGTGSTHEPTAVPRDTRGCSDIELEQAFNDDVYMWRGRCAICHADTQMAGDPAPPWISTLGNCDNGSAVTFKNVRDLGLIDTQDPTQSLILLKPLDRVGGGVAHGGGQKFASKLDPTYQSFLRFVMHYQACLAK